MQPLLVLPSVTVFGAYHYWATDWCLLCLFQIFKLKASLLADCHKKELAQLEAKHKNEMDELRIQTSRIATAVKREDA